MSMRDQNEEEFEVVDDTDNHQSFNVRLSLDMIDHGCEAIDEFKYLITDFASSNKNKQLVLDNYIELIAVLAFDSVSIDHERSKEITVFSLMANNVEGILNNYKLKAYPQEKVSYFYALYFMLIVSYINMYYLDVQVSTDWPVEVKNKIDMMRQKNATDTFIARNKTALQGKTPREKNEASFGSAMVTIARNTKTYIFKMR